MLRLLTHHVAEQHLACIRPSGQVRACKPGQVPACASACTHGGTAATCRCLLSLQQHVGTLYHCMPRADSWGHCSNMSVPSITACQVHTSAHSWGHCSNTLVPSVTAATRTHGGNAATRWCLLSRTWCMAHGMVPVLHAAIMQPLLQGLHLEFHLDGRTCGLAHTYTSKASRKGHSLGKVSLSQHQAVGGSFPLHSTHLSPLHLPAPTLSSHLRSDTQSKKYR